MKDANLNVRTRDPRFLEYTRRYFQAVGAQLGPLQITKGGPIIMVRVEGEYGAYGNDRIRGGLTLGDSKAAGRKPMWDS